MNTVKISLKPQVRMLYREYIKQCNLFRYYDPVSASVMKYNIRAEIEITKLKTSNNNFKMNEIINNKKKDIDMLKRANNGDHNGLKRVIRVLSYANLIKTYPDVSPDSSVFEDEVSPKLK
mmetsp:Transcript_30001/g.26571  ORF Transcript_30001/g.26571 Transcript_30001/m.26571 type:complete len:120 (+) Transcript_30001:12-371(+)